MITQTLYKQAFTVAKQLEAEHIKLKPREDTPLADLIEHCLGYTDTQSSTTSHQKQVNVFPNQDIPATSKTVNDMAIFVDGYTNNYNELTLHSNAIIEYAEALAPLIQSHISFAKNVVAPASIELAEKLHGYIERMRGIDPSAQFDIIQGVVPEILADEAFMSMGLNSIVNLNTIKESGFTISIPEEDNQDVLSMLLVGNERVNNMIQVWAAQQKEGFFEKVYTENFLKKDSGDRHTYGLDTWSLGSKNCYDVINLALAVWLIAYHLRQNPKAVKGITAAQYDAELYNLMEYAGVILLQHRDKAIQQITNNILVAEGNVYKKCVVVHKYIYLEWLKQGGCPEALLGMLVTSNFSYDATTALSRCEALAKSWANYVSMTEYERENTLKTGFISYLETEILQAINNPTEAEKEYFAEFPEAPQTIVRLMKEEINRLSPHLLNDVEHTARHIVAKCRYYYTASYDILTEMVELHKKNPNIDPHEASLVSVIKYLVNYFILHIKQA